MIFGGATNINAFLGVVGDTWTWNGSSWTQQNVVGPSKRYGAGTATIGGAVVLFGGNAATTSGTAGFLSVGDTWTWDGSTWTQQTTPGPGPRVFPMMCGP